MAPVAREILDAIEAGPIDQSLALPERELDRLLDPAPLEAEVGWCWLASGVGYVAMRTALPPGPHAMAEWWFEWHPHEDIRYRVWHPKAHVSNSVDPVAGPLEKPYWDVVHHPVEDVGFGVAHLRIEFKRPEAIGFSADALDRPGVAGIVGGFVGDERRRMRHTRMTHVFLDDPATGGYVLRSRFWIGSILRPYAPAAVGALVAAPVAALLNNRLVRRLAIPRAAPKGLALHCAEEYTQLAAILPDLYAHYGPGASGAD